MYLGVMDSSMRAPTPAITTHDVIHAGLEDTAVAVSGVQTLLDCGMPTSLVRPLLDALSRASDPDVALNNLVGIARAQHDTERNVFSDVSTPDAVDRLVAVLGSSDAMGKLMRFRPALVRAAGVDECDSHLYNREQRVAHMLHAIGADADAADADDAITKATMPFAQACSALRSSYHDQLAAIMAQDLTDDQPIDVQPQISRELSDLADASLEAALCIARHEVEHSERCRFTIVAMGKLGAQELNYVSDVDLIYVIEPATRPACSSQPAATPTSKSAPVARASAGAAPPESIAARTLIDSVSAVDGAPLDSHEGGRIDDQELIRIGTRLATTLQRVCQSAITGVMEPALWQIDGALRPEGKDGPLVRRLESHRRYYAQWARNWEFQALLKARPAAGDMALGEAYLRMVTPLVWTASHRDNFINDCQNMRRRVEDLIPSNLKEREIKLGKGGLRDVEFTVQMLQLVHGRTDASLRDRATLKALHALSQGGYVARNQATRLSIDYRFERVIEHRQQMWALKRTHLFPKVEPKATTPFQAHRENTALDLGRNRELRRLARAFRVHPEDLVQRFQDVRNEIRHLHMDIYYRPMLPINAQLEADQIELGPQATRDRFESIGFADPDAAIRHIGSLTSGVTRAAKINRILLPSVLQWLGQGQNPDMGLLNWTRLEERFGEGGTYLGLLRDSPMAARRLCHVLSNSRFLGDALNKSVESVKWLGTDALLQARDRDSLDVQCQATLERYRDSVEDFSNSLRAMRRQEIERIGLSWSNGVMDDIACLKAMTDVYDAIIAVALRWSVRHLCTVDGRPDAPANLAVIAMGRYGGAEVNFSSDADAIIVYRPAHGSGDEEAERFSIAVVNLLRTILQGPVSLEPKIELDLDLRPEGKNGPLARSFTSCEEYYRRWASTWEHQALLRARYAAGDRRLAEDFLRLIADPLRYPVLPPTPSAMGEIRTLKARMEAERLPRGIRREQHLKLGKGGLSDVEWTVQSLQLQHAGNHPELRVTSTLSALHQLERLHVVSQQDAAILRKSWRWCTAARNGNYLWTGRASQADIIPDDLESLGGIAVYLGYGAHRGQHFDNDLLTVMRQCRAVMERLFYDQHA